MARFSSILLGIVIVLTISTPIFAYSGGSGTPEDPYKISTAAELIALGHTPTDYDKSFILTADIDLAGQTFTHAIIAPNMSLDSGFQGTPFAGSLDGNGHIIRDAEINQPSKDYVGLFGYVHGQIRNLGIENVNITGRNYVGGLMGSNNGTILTCFATGAVSGTGDVGGLVGINYGAIISSCARGVVTGTDYYIGGLAGQNYQGPITSCYATGDINGNGKDAFVGGLVGHNYQGAITSSYSSSAVTSTREYVGGLIGYNVSGTITSCYATGAVNGNDYVGGLMGFNDGGMITSCFWDIVTSGRSTSAGGMGLTTTQMKMMSIYQNAGWSDKGWIMDDGVDYPRLVWEGTPGAAIPAPGAVPFAGSGTEADPYQIHTVEEFVSLRWYSPLLDKHIRLMADLDLSGISLSPVEPLTGTFDGSHHIIRNVVINQPDSDCVGLFSYIGTEGEIKNLGIEGANIQGRYYVGGLVGSNGSWDIPGGTITSCYADGAISGSYSVGGLAGMNSGTTTFSYARGNVISTRSYVGGLVGVNRGAIASCYAESDVTGSSSVGGLCGSNNLGAITGCYATGAVTGTGGYIGGLVGANEIGTITSCYATGVVNGYVSVGGLVGLNTDYSTITACYATGTISGTGNSVGGLVGNNSDYGANIACYWDMDTSGMTSSDGGTGKTTAEMKMLSTYTDAGWDFVGETQNGTLDIWIIPNGWYPILSWQQWAMIITPNGGESYTPGATEDIIWSAEGVGDQVLLQYSVDNGSTWIDIATVSNTGTYPWSIPNTLSNIGLVKISSVDDPSIFDISDAVFSIDIPHVYFADANLKAAVEAALGVTNPTAEDMLKLTALSAKNKGITSLVGLETALNLGGLSLDTNQVSDITPLAGLTKLATLTLYSNKVTDISPLAGLTKLYSLVLSANKVSDITPLAGLVNLVYLYINSNQISDFSALTGQTKLKEIYAARNAVLTKETYLAHIPAIRGNNANLTVFQYDPGCQSVMSTDANQDCRVNLADLAMMAADWLKCNHIYEEMCL